MSGESRRSQTLLTPEEYFEIEDLTRLRHEYVKGVLYRRHGSTANHNRLTMNVAMPLHDATAGTPAQVYTTAFKLRIDDDIFYYPDVMVVDDPTDDHEYWATRPSVIVEIVSPETESIDRREKMLVYHNLPSLRAYILVSETEARVERYERDDAGVWWHASIGRGGQIPVPVLDVTLSIEEIYDDIDLPTANSHDLSM